MFSIIKINFKYPKLFKSNLFCELFISKSQFNTSFIMNINRYHITYRMMSLPNILLETSEQRFSNDFKDQFFRLSIEVESKHFEHAIMLAHHWLLTYSELIIQFQLF